MADQAPPGVNMPKKRDPRLRQMQAPQQQQFFDSADYEVRKQQQQQQQRQHQHATPQPQQHSQVSPTTGSRRAPVEAPHTGAARGHAVPPPPPPPPSRHAPQ
ncbi:hypothetical protein NESM_000027400 [Novymonas esmeraldas]|uniref:Uncharacterized protein n=1 Tax=Novymonas esmeraldas TaxID=1808958 RepID=A0AAW0F2F0_9TRYP